MTPIKPGTYRITNVGGGTSIYVRDNGWDAACWAKGGHKNQQWYLQRSGAGYQIKNCWNNTYLAVSETRDGARIFCGRFPTTWEFGQGSKDHNQYMIKIANNPGFAIDLRHYGASHNGNEIDLCPVRDWLDCQKWRFEHLSDNTGDEAVVEIASKNKQIEGYKSQLAAKDAQLAQLTECLVSQNKELVSLRQANDLLRTQSIISPPAKLQNTSEHLEHEWSQQKKEENSLRESLESLEKRFTEMMEQNARPRNNIS
ncbi:hypothetical protein BDV93DRAFT_557325 [Ceratobasidium sp. AG-I]|nr:hypothetical protein BDV93DRAFT_557325 [Ceratobasidium sp. AG-I]